MASNTFTFDPWPEIKRLAGAARRRLAAVAYVTSDAHVSFKAGDVLVTDASENAIACGETSAKVLQAAHDRGAKLYTCPGLHAKVLVFDNVAIVGSANLSLRSVDHLIEATTITDDPTVVERTRAFITRLTEKSRRIDAAYLQHIGAMTVVRRPALFSRRTVNPPELGETPKTATVIAQSLQAAPMPERPASLASVGEAPNPSTSVVRFVDNDDGYRSWVTSNPDGFVVNCKNPPERDYVRLHKAWCDSVSGPTHRGNYRTKGQMKVCSTERIELDDWVRKNLPGRLKPHACAV